MVIVNQPASIAKLQNLERKAREFAFGREQKLPAIAQHRQKRVEDGTAQRDAAIRCRFDRRSRRCRPKVSAAPAFDLAGELGAKTADQAIDLIGVAEVDHPQIVRS